MRKGISTIIATIILVVITIGLISTAYIYFSSIVTVGPVVSSMVVPRCRLEGVDSYNITIYLKNEGTEIWNNIDWLFDGDTVSDPSLSNACDSVAAGTTGQCIFNSSAELAGKTVTGTHMFTAMGPRNQVAIPVTC